MRNVDASRADFLGASLAGVAAHGAKFRRAKCVLARMAGMWSAGADERPEVKAGKDGTKPFVDAHSTDIIQLTLGGKEAVKKALVGTIDEATVPASAKSGKAEHAPPAGCDKDIWSRRKPLGCAGGHERVFIFGAFLSLSAIIAIACTMHEIFGAAVSE